MLTWRWRPGCLCATIALVCSHHTRLPWWSVSCVTVINNYRLVFKFMIRGAASLLSSVLSHWLSPFQQLNSSVFKISTSNFMFLTNILTVLHSYGLIVVTSEISCSTLHSKGNLCGQCCDAALVQCKKSDPTFAPLRNAYILLESTVSKEDWAELDQIRLLAECSDITLSHDNQPTARQLFLNHFDFVHTGLCCLQNSWHDKSLKHTVCLFLCWKC